MKSHKLEKEVARHPWIMDILDDQWLTKRDSEIAAIRLSRILKKTRVNYVVFRLKRTVDLATAQDNTGITLMSDELCRLLGFEPPLTGDDTSQIYYIDWYIVYTVGQHSYAFSLLYDGQTLTSAAIEIYGLYQRGELGSGHLTFDFIAKKTYACHRGSPKNERVNLEIYSVPPLLLPRSIPVGDK